MNSPAVGALTCTDPVDEGTLLDPGFDDVEFPPVPEDGDDFCEVKLELPHPIVHMINAKTASLFTTSLPLARRKDTNACNRPSAIRFRRKSQADTKTGENFLTDPFRKKKCSYNQWCGKQRHLPAN